MSLMETRRWLNEIVVGHSSSSFTGREWRNQCSFFFKEKSIINPVGCSETATLLSTSTTLSCPRARSEKVALFISSAKQCDPREGKSHGKGPDGDFSTCFFFCVTFRDFHFCSVTGLSSGGQSRRSSFDEGKGIASVALFFSLSLSLLPALMAFFDFPGVSWSFRLYCQDC